MKTYRITYYLGNIHYTTLVDADNEAGAIQKVLDGMREGSKAILHDFTIERYCEEWN